VEVKPEEIEEAEIEIKFIAIDEDDLLA